MSEEFAVENFVKPCEVWSSDSYIGVVEDIVSQVYGEKAVLFKDKINFKGPKCAGFLAHQDATAFVTDELANHHISVMVALIASPPRGCTSSRERRTSQRGYSHERCWCDRSRCREIHGV